MQLHVIARARNGYKEKFGIPRQSGCATAVLTRIVFEPDYRNPDMLRGIDEFSHLWLLWGFHANQPTTTTPTISNNSQQSFSPTVRPPRLGGNKRIGVLATRSPFRPNPIGLSSVKLERIEKTSEGTVLWVSGADLMDSTPIYDIKPYIPYTDVHPDATGGFANSGHDYTVEVEIPEHIKNQLSPKLINELEQILSENPRPAYHKDKRVYGMRYEDLNVHFIVIDSKIEVLSVEYCSTV